MGICCMAKKLKQGLCVNVRGVGWGERWEGSSKEKGYMYTYGWFRLRFARKQQNSVKQLSFNKKKKTSMVWPLVTSPVYFHRLLAALLVLSAASFLIYPNKLTPEALCICSNLNWEALPDSHMAYSLPCFRPTQILLYHRDLLWPSYP